MARFRGQNEVHLIGTLGQKPTLRNIGKDRQVADFSIATHETWPNGEMGDRIEHTEWHNIQVWGKPAVNAEKYLVKGSRVSVTGKLRTNSYPDKTNKDIVHYRTRVIADNVLFLDRPDSVAPSAQAEEAAPPSGADTEL